ncbi:hypothetical protein F975_00845 [Acinetobacter sp. ANC 3789]|uniref:hypothetical protein n=1 Tax=Acinetobacter sp. ANC 3789 TaxID=1217714 RepID=UPI0002CECDAF|nr:hypothetical protein [Acinetobacter sp. ANC 3789]ENU80987.1 hypothetical protein F975_00845 [Acinetobacter sp. ANC 3789]
MSTLVKKFLIILCCISTISLSGCRLPVGVTENILEVIAKISGKLIAQIFLDLSKSSQSKQTASIPTKAPASNHNTSDVLDTTNRSISVQELEDAKNLQTQAASDTEEVEKNDMLVTRHLSRNDSWSINNFTPITDVPDIYAYIETLTITHEAESKDVGLELRKEIAKQKNFSITKVKIEYAYKTGDGYAYIFIVKDNCLFVEAKINRSWRSISPKVKAC